jgi:hypothetical protein
MLTNLAPFFIVGLFGGGLWVVWLVASFIPVDPRRLPWLLRMLRYTIATGNPARSVDVAVPFQTRSRDQFWIWRIFAGALVIGSQTIQLRSSSDPQFKSLAPAPLLEAILEWTFMAAWLLYVLWEFRRVERTSRT